MGPERLRTLTSLTLSENTIRQLPDDFFTLVPAVKRLDVSYNFLLDIPPLHGVQLQTFHADHNMLRAVPEEVVTSALEDLSLAYNHIEVLCDLSAAVGLRKLDVSHNLLTELPESISRLSSLRDLNVTSNRVGEVKGKSRQKFYRRG